MTAAIHNSGNNWSKGPEIQGGKFSTNAQARALIGSRNTAGSAAPRPSSRQARTWRLHPAEGWRRGNGRSAMGAAQTFLQGGQQLEGEHRCFLQCEQELLTVHFDQLTVLQGTRRAMAAMIVFHQGSNTKDLTRLKELLAAIRPGQLNLSGQHAIDGITGGTGGVDQLVGMHETNGQAAGEGLNRMQGRKLHGPSVSAYQPLSRG